MRHGSYVQGPCESTSRDIEDIVDVGDVNGMWDWLIPTKQHLFERILCSKSGPCGENDEVLSREEQSSPLFLWVGGGNNVERSPAFLCGVLGKRGDRHIECGIVKTGRHQGV